MKYSSLSNRYMVESFLGMIIILPWTTPIIMFHSLYRMLKEARGGEGRGREGRGGKRGEGKRRGEGRKEKERKERRGEGVTSC